MNNQLKNKLIYDKNYIVYHCFINIRNEFAYEIIPNDNIYLLEESLIKEIEYPGKIICINKKIPIFFHKMILYYYYIPSYYRK